MSHPAPTTLPDAESRSRLLKTLAYFAVFVSLGMGGVVLGPTLQGLAAHTAARLNEISILFSARAGGYMLGSFFSGRLYDRHRGHPLIAAALVAMTATLLLAPLIPVLWGLAAVMVALGVAEGGVDVGGNTMLVWAHGSRVGPYMNGLHFCWGAGAFLAPFIIAQAVLRSGDIVAAYWVISLCMLPPALALLRLPSPAAPAPATVRAGERASFKPVLFIMLFYFTYVGAEATFGGWIYSYAVAVGQADKIMAAYLTSLFWGALTLGRLVSVPIATRVQPQTVLLLDLLGCLASVAVILALPGSSLVLWLAAGGVGLFMASLFPTMISYAERQMVVSGQITGLFLFASGAGGMTIPWLAGQFFEVVGPLMTMALVFACLLAALLAFVAVLRVGGQHPRSDATLVHSA